MRKEFFFALIIFILTGCTNNNNPVQNNDLEQKVETDVSIDTLNLSMNVPKTFNPLKNEDVTVDEILRLVFEPIVKIKSDNCVENNLAQEITFDEDCTANIKLNNNILWANGDNLTADDIIFSIEQIKTSSENSIYKYVSDDVVSCKKNSAYDLDIKFKNGAYISIFLLDFPIIPKKYFANETENASVLMGSGAYKFSAYSQMKNLVLEKNDKYFAQPAEFKNINVTIVPDNETNIDAFNQKISNIIQTDLEEIGKFQKYTNKILYPTDELEFIFLNPTNNLFNIKPLHDSLINILPIEEIRNQIYSDNLSQSIFDIVIDQTNLEHAKQIIDEYKPDYKLKILVDSQNSQRVKAASLIKKTLSDYGIDSIIEKKNFDEYKSAFQNKNFDIFIGGFVPRKKFDYENIFGEENILGYKNQDMTEKWMHVKLAKNKVEFDKAIENLQSSLNDSQIIILGRKNTIFLANKNIQFENFISNFFAR